LVVVVGGAGFFYAYGSSVLLGLDELPPSESVRAMQAINARVRNWMFAPSFFGSLGLTALALAGFAMMCRWKVAWIAAALILYGVGAFLVTLWVSVPLNVQLARVDPRHEKIAQIAAEYFEAWRCWNWVRTLAGAFAVAALAMACREDGRQVSAQSPLASR
jgi:uncharacterized membrane protein